MIKIDTLEDVVCRHSCCVQFPSGIPARGGSVAGSAVVATGMRLNNNTDIEMTTTRIPVLVLTLVLAVSTVSAADGQVNPASSRPNILFIVSDDHGWGDLPSNWDKTEVRLPALNSLAAKGVRFSNYHTVPLCGPSRACMFTGQFSTENGMWRVPVNNRSDRQAIAVSNTM